MRLISSIFRYAFVAFAASVTLTSCDESIKVDLPGAEGSVCPPLSVTASTENASLLEFRDVATETLYLRASTILPTERIATVVVSEEALEEYNDDHGSRYVAYPTSLVTLSNGGETVIAAGAGSSEPVTVTITSDSTLDPDTEYAIALRATCGTDKAVYVIPVRDMTALADCHKSVTDAAGNAQDAVTLFSCMEINDTNPLNNLRYRLAGSGKYVVDAVVLFAANINFDPNASRVYINCNQNVQHLLNNRVKYLKPLRDRGIRVLLGLLCNHDRACIANLSDETARRFAAEIKAICDAYELDGVFYDDEYCDPIVPAPEGFVTPSNKAFSRLAYEVWKLQPERWNVAYVLSNTSRAVEIDGTLPGTYLTHALNDYGRSNDLTQNYPGMQRSAMGLYSQEFARGYFASETNLRRMRTDGYGAHMVFAMDPFRSNASRQDAAMTSIARALYDDELLIDDTFRLPKDWD